GDVAARGLGVGDQAATGDGVTDQRLEVALAQQCDGALGGEVRVVGGREQLLDPVEDAFADGEVEAFFSPEVVVDGADRDVGGVGDLLDAHGRVRVGGEHRLGLVEDAVPFCGASAVGAAGDRAVHASIVYAFKNERTCKKGFLLARCPPTGKRGRGGRSAVSGVRAPWRAHVAVRVA